MSGNIPEILLYNPEETDLQKLKENACKLLIRSLTKYPDNWQWGHIPNYIYHKATAIALIALQFDLIYTPELEWGAWAHVSHHRLCIRREDMSRLMEVYVEWQRTHSRHDHFNFHDQHTAAREIIKILY